MGDNSFLLAFSLLTPEVGEDETLFFHSRIERKWSVSPSSSLLPLFSFSDQKWRIRSFFCSREWKTIHLLLLNPLFFFPSPPPPHLQGRVRVQAPPVFSATPLESRTLPLVPFFFFSVLSDKNPLVNFKMASQEELHADLLFSPFRHFFFLSSPFFAGPGGNLAPLLSPPPTRAKREFGNLLRLCPSFFPPFPSFPTPPFLTQTARFLPVRRPLVTPSPMLFPFPLHLFPFRFSGKRN